MQIAERLVRRLGLPVAAVDVQAAGEAERAVDHQDLAVVAQVERMQARGHERRVEHRDVDAALAQRLHRRAGGKARIDVVDQHAHLDAALRCAGERGDELGADAVAVEDVG